MNKFEDKPLEEKIVILREEEIDLANQNKQDQTFIKFLVLLPISLFLAIKIFSNLDQGIFEILSTFALPLLLIILGVLLYYLMIY